MKEKMIQIPESTLEKISVALNAIYEVASSTFNLHFANLLTSILGDDPEKNASVWMLNNYDGVNSELMAIIAISELAKDLPVDC